MDDATQNHPFEVLSSEHRRHLLLALLEAEPQHDRVSDSTDRRRVAFAHVHLPVLEEAGYVRWHWERGEITRGPNFEEVRPTLEELAGAPRASGD